MSILGAGAGSAPTAGVEWERARPSPGALSHSLAPGAPDAAPAGCSRISGRRKASLLSGLDCGRQ